MKLLTIFAWMTLIEIQAFWHCPYPTWDACQAARAAFDQERRWVASVLGTFYDPEAVVSSECVPLEACP